MPALPTEPAATPTGPMPYHHGLRRHSGNIWRGIVALLILAVVFFAAQFAAGIVLLAESGLDLDNLRITPVGMLATNLALAALWPAGLLIQRILYGPRPGTLHSVAGKIRWRLFAILAAVLLPAYAIYVALSPVIMPGAEGPGETGTLTGPVVAGFIVVALLTTPLQSAGEEVAFRGLIPRVVGGWFAKPRVALVVGAAVSSVLFALAHGAGDMWLNAYYLIFAISLTVMTWRTQGLEAAIIAHAANNTFLMVLNSARGVEFDDMFERQAGVGGPFMLVAMVMCVLATALVWWRTGRPKAREALQLPQGISPNP